MARYHRTIDEPVPAVGEGRRWIARALLEGASPDGPWDALEANVEGVHDLTGPMSTRFAKRDPGWYCIQWRDDQGHNHFTDAVLVGARRVGRPGGR